ncbi:hypothetical protein B0H13DRAFT_1850584 [Mycena leptocephala]|nr:hypothetical protein B0H13DRAFT_1850584 [Mycena leptocephala]
MANDTEGDSSFFGFGPFSGSTAGPTHCSDLWVDTLEEWCIWRDRSEFEGPVCKIEMRSTKNEEVFQECREWLFNGLEPQVDGVGARQVAIWLDICATFRLGLNASVARADSVQQCVISGAWDLETLTEAQTEAMGEKIHRSRSIKTGSERGFTEEECGFLQRVMEVDMVEENRKLPRRRYETTDSSLASGERLTEFRRTF